MRRFLVSLFCLFFLLSGPISAWAECFRHSHGIVEEQQHHHHFNGHHFDSGISATHDHSRSPSWPIIHCPTAEQRLGPALQVVSPNLNRFDLITSVHASFIPEPASPASRNSLWLEALFKRILAFSLPNDLARHLFLSILQI
jgi:hypothetical protein